MDDASSLFGRQSKVEEVVAEAQLEIVRVGPSLGTQPLSRFASPDEVEVGSKRDSRYCSCNDPCGFVVLDHRKCSIAAGRHDRARAGEKVASGCRSHDEAGAEHRRCAGADRSKQTSCATRCPHDDGGSFDVRAVENLAGRVAEVEIGGSPSLVLTAQE